MIEISDKSQCCGCSACADLCPKQCIGMKADREGFLYAEVDAARCIECGLCERVCPMISRAERKWQAGEANACWSKSDEVHRSSTSGGVAYELGRYTLGKGGVVYGCTGTDPYHICHKRIDNMADLASTQGSKYVQSFTGGIFSRIRKDVAAGLQVLFVGTPCQAAAVRNIYGDKTPENLLIADIICHGVPSQTMLNKQLDTTARGNRLSSITSVSFRQSNDNQYSLTVRGIKNGNHVEVKEDAFKNPYYKCFIYGLNYRESCYRCPYAESKRSGDLTLGDFWGFQAVESLRFKQTKGLSLVLANTPKGRETLEALRASIEVIERPLNEAIEGNDQLRRPVGRSMRVKMYRLFNRFLPESISSKVVFIDEKVRLRK